MQTSLGTHSSNAAAAASHSVRGGRAPIHSVFGLIHPITRRLRMRRFERELAPIRETSILDVGGTAYNWQFVGAERRVVLLNLTPPSERGAAHFEWAIGDGRNLSYADRSFDIAYSNSVIEHVGSFDDQRRFANELRRVGQQVWVQTPARECPVEPHYLTLFVHWLPVAWRRPLVRYCSFWGWVQRPTKEQVDAMVGEIRLLNRKEMEELFPDCEILTERFLFIPRSHIAIRR